MVDITKLILYFGAAPLGVLEKTKKGYTYTSNVVNEIVVKITIWSF